MNIRTFTTISELVYTRLSTITEIGTRVFPIIAENSTNYPFVVYSRDSLTPTYCKDGCIEDNVDITLRIVSATYWEGIDIANSARTVLTLKNHIGNGGAIINSTLNSASESYEENAYIQTLSFSFNITSNT